MNIIWGPESIQIYNDGYRVVCGDVHPRALGEDYRVTWASAFPVIGDSFDRAWAGERMFLENQRMFLKRLNGSGLEETFFTFSHSPIQDESGGVGGLFHPVTETTANMLAERRTRALRDLAASLASAADEADVARRTVDMLARFDFDLPFMLYYVLDAKSGRYELLAHHGIAPGTSPTPPSLAPDDSRPWPFSEALSSASIVEVDDLPSTVLHGAACGPYEEPPNRGFVIPIVVPAAEQAPAVIVTAASSRLPLTADYRSFYDLLGVTIAGALSAVRAREDERRRAEALAEIDRAKTAFFSNVSHEFRTPLTLMLGPLEEARGELARSGASESATQLRQIDLAHRNGLRLLKLVNTLLDFSRIEAGRVQAVYEPTDLGPATAELASVFRSAVEKAGLSFKVDCPELPEPAYVDREMWEKIVLNLISNAFKFTFEGEIEVSLRERDGRVKLAVRDTGTGIPPDELPKLFERFHRVAGARGRTYEGSGIGLALVQELAKLHGGSVAVDSALGRGSTFTVTVPLGRSHLPASQIGALRTQSSTALGASPFVEEALRWLPDSGSGEDVPISDMDRVASTAQSSEDRARIVLADDNADMRDYVRRLLTPHYEVEGVADGEAALRAIARDRPDLVLSDIMMPRLDGMELLGKLRADPQTADLPIILLSARAGEESRVEGMQAGADDYLIKPFSARELLARVESNLRLTRVRADAERELRAREERYRQLVEQTPDGIFVADAEGQYIDVNPAGCHLLGMTRAEVLASVLTDVVAPEEHHRLVPEIARFEDGSIVRSEWRMRRKDGSTFDAEIVGRRLPNGNLQGIVRDVTVHRHREQALRESEERFRRMADHAPVMIWVTEPDGSCTFLSQSWYEFTGQTPETGLGFGWLDATHPDDRESATNTFLAANAKHESFRIEYRLRRKDGEYRWAIDAAAPRFSETGRFLGYIGSVIDITERKQSEEALRRNHETFFNLVQDSPLGVYLVDSQFRLVQVSQGALPAFRNVHPLIGHDFADALRIIWPEPFASEAIERFRHTLATGEPYLAPSLTHERRDLGSVESYEWQIRRVTLPDGQFGVVCYYYDSTKLRQAEASLRESEERFRMLADNMNQLAWTCDRLGEVTWYNQRWLDYTGFSFEEMKGWGWRRVISPDHVDHVVASVTRSRDSGEPWESTFPLRGEGGQYRWFLSRAVPIQNSDGEIVRWFGTNTDITEQRQADETQRLLTSELSHRVKNMLATVQAIATQTLRHNKSPAEFVTSFGGRIQSMSRIHSMLSSSDWQGASLRDIIRDQLLLGAVDESRVTAWGPAVRLEPQMAPQVAMMLHELGTNSIKYGALSAADGSVTIDWSVEDDALRLRWAERGGPRVEAPVRRGFGTTLIEQSAKGVGGSAQMSIEAESVQWKISLPLPRLGVGPSPATEFVNTAPRTSEHGGADAPPILAGKRLLVVEDEPLVALEIAETLRQAGAEIAGSVGTASAALTLIERTTLDAVLLDANLHGQSVGEIAAALTRKNVPFAFVTGYGSENLPPAFGGVTVLSKPFSQPQLLEAAAKLVRKSAGVRKLRS